MKGRIRTKNVWILSGVALVVAAWGATPALARVVAPEYVSSEPEDGAQVHEAPDRVSATFSEPLDPSSSDMRIHDECGQRIDDRDLQFNVNEMSVGLHHTPSGEYHVAYVAVGLGGVTGTTKGSFSFTVHAGASCDGAGGHQHGGRGGDHKEHGGGGGHGGGDHGDHGDHGGGEHGDHAGHSEQGGHTDHSGMGAEHGDDHHHKSDQVKGKTLTNPDPDRKTDIAAPERRDFAGGPTSAEATGAVALIAFVLAGAFGVVGGWLLRQSDRLSRP